MIIIDEQTSIAIDITCTDDEGNEIIPTTLTYSLYNQTNNTKLFEETTTPTTSKTTINILQAHNNIITDTNRQETLIFTYKWTYPIDKGETGIISYKINNLKYI